MYERIKSALLRILRVPSEPRPPAGSPGSLVVFRAARNFYRYRIALWALKQGLGIVGFVAFLVVFGVWGQNAVVERLERLGEQVADDPETLDKVHEVQDALRKVRQYAGILETIEWLGLAFLVVQLPLSYAWVRLDYEMRWYLATDRSLRLRDGVWTVREMTLTYPNVQNVTIEQGPLQRLLGIADLVVQTAGGGSERHRPGERGTRARRSMHEGRLHGVEQAEGIRDLILAHLKRLRDGGLGDAEEQQAPRRRSAPIDAARQVLREARALREAVERGRSSRGYPFG